MKHRARNSRSRWQFLTNCFVSSKVDSCYRRRFVYDTNFPAPRLERVCKVVSTYFLFRVLQLARRITRLTFPFNPRRVTLREARCLQRSLKSLRPVITKARWISNEISFTGYT